MKIKAGSRAMLVSFDRLLKVSFSVQAQIPMANTPRPRSCNKQQDRLIKFLAGKCSKLTQKMTLKPKMTYLRQHETSLVSRILRLLL